MAKQIGSVKFKGTVGGFSFYRDRVHGYLVRRTGGVTSKQYHKDKRYAAARDASSEFATVSRAGKLIRDAFGAFALQVKDSTMVNRLNKELVALKQLDNKNARGQRRPETMLADLNANKYFCIFQFNENVKVYELTDSFPAIIKHSNKLTIRNLKLTASAFPEGATHAGLTMARTVIDFEKGFFETASSGMALVSKDDNRKEVSLLIDPEELTIKKGTEILCLQVVFFKENGGKLVQLKGKVHGMGIVAVNEYQTRIVHQIRRNYIGNSRRYHQPVHPHQGKMKQSSFFNASPVSLTHLLINNSS